MDFNLIHPDGIAYLQGHTFKSTDLIYCDPPYLTANRNHYRIGMTKKQHTQLVKVIKELPCMVIISGYWSELYAEQLAGWNTAHFEVSTRDNARAEEWLWYNYPIPNELHDHRYLGENFREREKINRMKKRWVERLKRMPMTQQLALLDVLLDQAIRDAEKKSDDGRHR